MSEGKTLTEILPGMAAEIAAKDKQIAELEKDRARLEWMAARAGAVIVTSNGYFAEESPSVDDGFRWYTGIHKDWRDAIDEAMAGVSDA